MKKVLVLGAGMVVTPIEHYLLDNHYEVTLASRTKAKAKRVLEGYSKGRALDVKAKEAGIIIMNEIGVDPGYDHMTAMEIIDRVHNEGGKVDEFYSLCGALCAPEASDNPFRYKFSWSPKGVMMASNNGARFLKNGQVEEVDTSDLFKKPMMIDYGNRNYTSIARSVALPAAIAVELIL